MRILAMWMGLSMPLFAAQFAVQFLVHTDRWPAWVWSGLGVVWLGLLLLALVHEVTGRPQWLGRATSLGRLCGYPVEQSPSKASPYRLA